MILILGAGESGVGAALLAKKQQLPVFVSDGGSIRNSFKNELIEAEIDFEEGSHDIAMEITPEFIIKSPGIPDHSEIITHFRNINCTIISEIEFAYRYCRGTIIGITGSNGKTTTTNLIYHFLNEVGKNVIKAGNIGYSFSRALSIKDWDYYVLELSSFQLDGIDKFKPHISVLLNITPDHLDRYQYQFEKYIYSKFKIAQNQEPSDFLVVYGGDQAITEYLNRNNLNVTILKLNPVLNKKDEISLDGEHLADLSHTTLKGRHNAINVCCAASTVKILGLNNLQIQQALNNFINDPHRLETVAVINGITFINDSKATNVDSVFWAMDAMKQKIVWIAGGQDKGNDYSVLEPLVKQKVSALVCLGVDNQKLIKSFNGIIPKIEDTHSIHDAVQTAMRIGSSGEVVLLSPACASFDLFKNYEDRGLQFKNEVNKLKLSKH